jgi:hypothetical protein
MWATSIKGPLVKTQRSLSLSAVRSLAFWFRGCINGVSKIFCLFAGGGIGDELELDSVDVCGVVFFRVEAYDCDLGGDGPPISHQ